MADTPSSECNMDIERSYLNASYIDVNNFKVFYKTIKLLFMLFLNKLTDNFFRVLWKKTPNYSLPPKLR